MSSTTKRRSTLLGASLGAAGTARARPRPRPGCGRRCVLGAATPPSNTSPPTVSGTVQKGQQLHAEPGSWSGSTPIGFAYRWQRCNAGGGSCSNIGGATHRDYTLGSADVGHTVRVVVTASNSAGSATAASSPTAVVAAPQAPANTVPPTISGDAPARPDPDGQPRQLDRVAADHVHVPVAPLRPGRRRLREHLGRDERDAPAHVGRRRPCAPRPRAGEEPVRRDVGDDRPDRGRVVNCQRVPDRVEGRLRCRRSTLPARLVVDNMQFDADDPAPELDAARRPLPRLGHVQPGRAGSRRLRDRRALQPDRYPAAFDHRRDRLGDGDVPHAGGLPSQQVTAAPDALRPRAQAGRERPRRSLVAPPRLGARSSLARLLDALPKGRLLSARRRPLLVGMPVAFGP